MDQAQHCLFVVLAFSCLTQLVTPVPMVIDAELDYDTKEPIPIAEDIFDLKDKTDMFNPTPVLLTRFRRQMAQWLQGSQHINDYDYESTRPHNHPSYRNRNNEHGVIAQS